MTAPRYRIVVDHDRCVGSTLCTQFAPGAFQLDANGQSEVKDAGGAAAKDILEAAEQCPQCAIILVDAASGEQVFP